jgi:hypothetical protein
MLGVGMGRSAARNLTMRVCLVATAILLASPIAAGSDLTSAKVLADRAIQLIERGSAEDVAELLHYPPTYTEAERKEDSGAVADSIRFLLGRTGQISNPKPWLKPAEFFEVGAGGGDMPYWQSLSPLRTIDYVYSVQYEKLGSGFLKVRAFKHPSIPKPAIMSIGIGFPVADPDSKKLVIALIRGLTEHKGHQAPPNLEEILEQTLKPEVYPGTRESPQ